MLKSIQSLLDALPEGVIQVRNGLVSEANSAARRYLPQLVPNAPLPSSLDLTGVSSSLSGTFSDGGRSYTFSCTRSDEEQIILFHPISQPVFSERQLSGALRQLRGLLGDLLAVTSPAVCPGQLNVDACAFSKSFHRLVRLVHNLEYLQEAASSDGSPFSPVTMDLDGLCRQTAELAGDLLAQAQITLDYDHGTIRGLLMPGDPKLLQRMILGLISNAALSAGTDRILLALQRHRDRAVLTLSHNGPAPSDRQLAQLLQQDLTESIPLPGQGAGLGLAVIRHIVSLHGGTMFPVLGDSAPTMVISLPTGPLDPRTTVSTPPLQRDGGLDSLMVELADVLPARLFGLEGLD